MSSDFRINNEPRTKESVCQRHGPYESKNFLGNVWTACPECVRIGNEQREQLIARGKGKNHKANAHRLLGQPYLPEYYQTRTLSTFVADTPEKRRALDFCKDYALNFPANAARLRCAVFLGNVGTGKTHLACATAMEIERQHGKNVLHVTVERAMQKIRSTYNHNSQITEDEMTELFRNVDFLILDEIGVQTDSARSRINLTEILTHRFATMRPTFFLTNLDLAELSGILGEQVSSRLREAPSPALSFNWEDQRGRYR